MGVGVVVVLVVVENVEAVVFGDCCESLEGDERAITEPNLFYFSPLTVPRRWSYGRIRLHHVSFPCSYRRGRRILFADQSGETDGEVLREELLKQRQNGVGGVLRRRECSRVWRVSTAAAACKASGPLRLLSLTDWCTGGDWSAC